MNNYLLADLHVHSALSPCAVNEMTPQQILAAASKSGISLLGVADHNAAGNVEAFLNLAPKYNITIVPAMEVETVEEVHVLTLFSDLDALLAWEKIVHEAMLPIPNDPSIFGDQLLFDHKGQLKDKYPYLLAQSCAISLEKVVESVMNLGGVTIPSHIYRKANGIKSVLGFIPPDLGISTVEISRQKYQREGGRFEVDSNYNLIVNSDAHCLRDLYGSPSIALQIDQNNAKSVVNMLGRKLSTKEVVII